MRLHRILHGQPCLHTRLSVCTHNPFLAPHHCSIPRGVRLMLFRHRHPPILCAYFRVQFLFQSTGATRRAGYCCYPIKSMGYILQVARIRPELFWKACMNLNRAYCVWKNDVMDPPGYLGLSAEYGITRAIGFLEYTCYLAFVCTWPCVWIFFPFFSFSFFLLAARGYCI